MLVATGYIWPEIDTSLDLTEKLPTSNSMPETVLSEKEVIMFTPVTSSDILPVMMSS